MPLDFSQEKIPLDFSADPTDVNYTGDPTAIAEQAMLARERNGQVSEDRELEKQKIQEEVSASGDYEQRIKASRDRQSRAAMAALDVAANPVNDEEKALAKELIQNAVLESTPNMMDAALQIDAAEELLDNGQLDPANVIWRLGEDPTVYEPQRDRLAKQLMMASYTQGVQEIIDGQTTGNNFLDWLGRNLVPFHNIVATKKVLGSETDGFLSSGNVRQGIDIVESSTPEEFLQFMEALQKNDAGILGENPGKRREIYEALSTGLTNNKLAQQKAVLDAGAIDVVDIGSVLEVLNIGKLAKMGSPRLYSEIGARNKALMEIATEAKRFEAGQLVDLNKRIELVKAMVPDHINPDSVGLGTGVALASTRALRKINEAENVIKNIVQAERLPEEARIAAIQATEAQLKADLPVPHDELADVKMFVQQEEGTKLTEVQLRWGNGNQGYTTESEALAAANDVYKEIPGSYGTHQDPVSQRWFLTRTRYVDETASNLTNLKIFNDNPQFGEFNRRLGSALEQYDAKTRAQVVIGDHAHSAVMKTLKDLYKIMDRFGVDRRGLTLAIKQSEKDQHWYTIPELQSMFGKDQKTIEGYLAYREIFDIQYALDNQMDYAEAARRGFAQAIFKGTKKHDGLERFDVREVTDIDGMIREKMYDVSKGEPVLEDFTPITLKKFLKDNDYVVLQPLEMQPQLFDDTYFGYLLVKRDQFATKKLHPVRFEYIEGGHRQYNAKRLIKQARIVEDMFGRKVYKRPRVIHISDDIKHADEYASTLEQIRLAYVAGDKALVDTLISTKAPLLKNFDNFDAMVKRGDIGADQPIVSVRDGEVPRDPDGLWAKYQTSAMDEMLDYSIARGRRYAQSKGEKKTLPGSEEYAPLLNPYEVTQRAIAQIADQQAYSNLKVRSVEGWVATYKAAGIFDPESMSHKGFYQNFDRAVPLGNLTIEQKQLLTVAETQRDNIRRLIGQKSKLGEMSEIAATKSGEFIAKRLGMKNTGNFVIDKMSKDPVTALKGFAFDTKIGFFGIDQLIVQPQTAWLALSVDPKNGFEAFRAVVPLRWARINGTTELKSYIAKNGTPVHGMTKEEFLELNEFFDRSGFDVVDTEMSLLDDKTTATVWNTGVARGAQKFRQAGRQFFYEGERLNRLVGGTIAYKRWKAKNPDVTKLTDNHIIEIADEAELFAANMSRSGNAWWQSGAMGIPTQFLSYQARVIQMALPEALGGTARLTAREKAQLAAGQVVFYGAAGVPPILGLQSMYEQAVGEQMPEGFAKDWMRKGIFDTIITDVSTELGAPINAATRERLALYNRFAPAEWLDPDAGFLEVIGGPAYDTGVDFIDVMQDMLWIGAIESRHDLLPMTEQVLMDMGKVASSFNGVTKSILAFNTGYLYTNSGQPLAPVNKYESFMVALRLPVEQQILPYEYLKDKKNVDRMVQEVSGELRVLERDAMLALQRGDQEKAEYLAHIGGTLIHSASGGNDAIQMKILRAARNTKHQDFLNDIFGKMVLEYQGEVTGLDETRMKSFQETRDN